MSDGLGPFVPGPIIFVPNEPRQRPSAAGAAAFANHAGAASHESSYVRMHIEAMKQYALFARDEALSWPHPPNDDLFGITTLRFLETHLAFLEKEIAAIRTITLETIAYVGEKKP